jgi:hypothetical protein
MSSSQRPVRDELGEVSLDRGDAVGGLQRVGGGVRRGGRRDDLTPSSR